MLGFSGIDSFVLILILCLNLWFLCSYNCGNRSGTKRPIVPVTSSSALASQLYRSSSFHSSGPSSGGDGEEMYSDGSLEDEVIDLTQKVKMFLKIITQEFCSTFT